VTGADRLARFDELARCMPRVADAVAGFDEDLRETAFWALVNIVNPARPDDSVVDVTDGEGPSHQVRALQAELAAERSEKDRLAAQLDRLGRSIARHYPGAFPLSAPVVDSAIRLLTERWTGPVTAAAAAATAAGVPAMSRPEDLPWWRATARLRTLEGWLAEHLPGERRGGEDAVDTVVRVLHARVLDTRTKTPDPRTVAPGMGCV
jgi:hypothetical protein